jgi:DMSO/TMAO reductase YedYZ molybdopterin-dependent catalytic subunit
MKKTFARFATISILLIFFSLAYNLTYHANTAAASIDVGWQLTVDGLVENPLNLNGSEILTMPRSTVNGALFCVDFPGRVLMQGNWTGIKLRTLLEEAKPLPSAIKIAFFAADGYSTDLTVETAMLDDVILAYENEGVSLKDLRLVVPGKWGYKWISQLTHIELVDYNYLGRWESAGYSDEADWSSSDALPPAIFVPSLPASSPTPSPITSPSPSPTQPPVTSPEPFDQSTLTTESIEDKTIPTEVVYAIAVLAVAVVLLATITFVRKKMR